MNAKNETKVVKKKKKNNKKKKNVQPVQKEKIVLSNVSAPRRNPKYRKQAVSDNSKITPVTALEVAPGVLNNIDVLVTFVDNAVRSVPLGLLSMAAARGAFEFMYSQYKIMYADIVDLMAGGPGVAPSRLAFQNDIYGSFVPKTIPFRRDCTISYKNTPLDPTPSNTVSATNGYTFYMYQSTGGGLLGFNLQVPPSVSTDADDRSNYINMLGKLAGKQKHIQIARDVSLTTAYRKDVSAYTRVSPFFGSSNGVGAPYSSCEIEVPYRSPLLGTFINFSPATPRASRVLDKTSGDSCSNYAIGAIPTFSTSFYNGAVPPEYKFLDMYECVFLLCQILIAGLTAFFTGGGTINAENSFLDSGLGMPQSTFILMLRQQLLWMFVDSQCLGQFLSPDVGSTTFQSFLCGSNCYPREPSSKMRVTGVFNENMRMLKMVLRPYVTNNFLSNRNHITQIPVWGMYKEYALVNFTYVNSQGIVTNLFTPEPSDAPNVFDGTFNSGDVADLNTSPPIQAAVADWNEFVNALSNIFASLDTLGGDSNGSPLLQFTRYVQYIAVDERAQKREKHEVVLLEGQRVPKLFKSYVTDRKRLEKQTSKKEIVFVDHVMSIPESTPFSEFPLAVSGMIPITPTHKEFLCDLIIPTIDSASTDNLPSQSQYQVAVLEPYSFVKSAPGEILSSRAVELNASTYHHVVGLAGRKSALAGFLTALSDNNEGGFFGDLFSFAGEVANTFGV